MDSGFSHCKAPFQVDFAMDFPFPPARPSGHVPQLPGVHVRARSAVLC